MNNNKETRHAATDPQKCRNMERKYGWRLKRIERTGDPVLKVDCVFEGDAIFPDYRSKQDNE